MLLLLCGVFASVFGGHSILASDSLELSGARHEVSHALFETHKDSEALEILHSLDNARVRSNYVALALFASGILLIGLSFSSFRRASGKAAGSVS